MCALMWQLSIIIIFFAELLCNTSCLVPPNLVKAGTDPTKFDNTNSAGEEDYQASLFSSDYSSQLSYLNSSYEANFCNESLEQNCEQIIVAYLFNAYSKVPRPVQNDSWVTPVQLNPGFKSMLEIEQISQTVTLNLWMRIYWYDYYLMWDPKEFGGKEQVKVPVNYIWMPDIVLFQELGKTEPMRQEMRRVSINYDGKVSLLYPAVHRIFCPLQMSHFPFDTQNCELRFGTWFHTANEIFLSPKTETADIRFFQSNSEWKLEGINVTHEYVFYFNEPYSEVSYTITLKRHPTFYICTLVIPTSLIMVVSIVGLFSPSKGNEEREEKISMGITTLLTLAVLLLMISDQMPKSANEIPIVAVFIMIQLVLCVISSLCTVIMIKLQRQAIWGISPSKRWKNFCRLFGKLPGDRVSITEPRHDEPSIKLQNISKVNNHILVSDNWANGNGIKNTRDKEDNNNNCNGNEIRLGKEKEGDKEERENKEERRRKRQEAWKQKQEENKGNPEKEWTAVCGRLDELLKWFFLALSLLSLIWLLLVGFCG